MSLTARFFPFALTVALLGTLSVPNVADAVNGQLKARISAAKADMKESKKLLKDDKKDLRGIDKISAKWHAARESGNTDKMARVDEDLLEWLREELAENRQDRARARAELESTGAQVNPQPTRTHPGSRRGRAVDRGPQDNERQADARSDFEAEREDSRNTREIAESLRDVQRRYEAGTAGPRIHTQKSELLRDLVRSARRDYRRSTRELAEDEARFERLKARR